MSKEGKAQQAGVLWSGIRAPAGRECRREHQPPLTGCVALLCRRLLPLEPLQVAHAQLHQACLHAARCARCLGCRGADMQQGGEVGLRGLRLQPQQRRVGQAPVGGDLQLVMRGCGWVGSCRGTIARRGRVLHHALHALPQSPPTLSAACASSSEWRSPMSASMLPACVAMLFSTSSSITAAGAGMCRAFLAYTSPHA